MANHGASAKDRLLARFRDSSEFPAMSTTIDLLSQLNSTEETSIAELSNIILRDYALTSKTLKLVNSVYYSHYTEVTTISRAIILLGFENIKNVALTLMLFDHFQKNSANTELVEILMRSLYSGVLAQKIANDINFVDKEEAFICALFHTFGKILVAFYLPEENREIVRISEEKGMSREIAAMSVLGTTFMDIGMTVAREWHFPERIVNSMRKVRSSELTSKLSDLEKLYSISSVSNEIADILMSNLEKKEKDERLEKHLKPFRDNIKLLNDKITEFMTSSMKEVAEYSNTFGIKLNSAPIAKRIARWFTDIGLPKPDFEKTAPLASLDTIDTIIEVKGETTSETIFTKGIQDVNSAILNNYAINDIIRIVLETIYRGMQLSGTARVLFFIKDTRLPVMNIRFGFGNGIEELKKWFEIPVGSSDDIFNMAISRQNDLVIKDIRGEDIRALIPGWFRNKISSPVFLVILPIIINNKAIGMFYIEGEIAGFQNISGGHLNNLKILRDQIVLAIKQKQGY